MTVCFSWAKVNKEIKDKCFQAFINERKMCLCKPPWAFSAITVLASPDPRLWKQKNEKQLLAVYYKSEISAVFLIFSDLWTFLQLAQPVRLLLEYTGIEYEDKFYRCGEGKTIEDMIEKPSSCRTGRSANPSLSDEPKFAVFNKEKVVLCLLTVRDPFFPCQRQIMTRAAGLTKNLILKWISPT